MVLEQGDAIAPQWRARYDRLRLNSARWFSTLPDGPAYPRGTETFPSRDERRRLPRRLRRAPRARRPLRASRSSASSAPAAAGSARPPAVSCTAEQVIVAGGLRAPAVRSRRGRAARASGATVLHAAGYRNAEPFRGQDVLVVGPGCTGAEIAYDLVEGGAAAGAARGAHAAEHHRCASRSARRWPSVFAKLPPRIGDAVMRFVAGARRSATHASSACRSPRRASSAGCGGCTWRR